MEWFNDLTTETYSKQTTEVNRYIEKLFHAVDGNLTLKCYYDQKYEFFVLSIFQKYKYILLTVQSFKLKFVREVRFF